MREVLPYVQRTVSREAGTRAAAAFLGAFDRATDECRRDVARLLSAACGTAMPSGPSTCLGDEALVFGTATCLP